MYQDNEDTDNSNDKSDPFSVFGTFGTNTRTYYCTFSSCSQSPWPIGTYCIVRYGSCPSGFEEGGVFWDDEDGSDEDHNKNYVYGSVPYMDVGHNTKLYYCCRDDGSLSTPISLPTGTPFYLLQKSSAGCQRVAGLRDRRDWRYSDDEDDGNHNELSGNHPYVTGSTNYKIYYCYYY